MSAPVVMVHHPGLSILWCEFGSRVPHPSAFLAEGWDSAPSFPGDFASNTPSKEHNSNERTGILECIIFCSTR